MDKLTALSATKHITHTQRWSWLAYASIVVSAGQRFSRAARLSILFFFSCVLMPEHAFWFRCLRQHKQNGLHFLFK